MAVDKKRILSDFFSEGLSEEDKKVFLELASSDPDFLRSFIKITELNSLIEKGTDSINSKRTSPKKKTFIFENIGSRCCCNFGHRFFSIL